MRETDVTWNSVLLLLLTGVEMRREEEEERKRHGIKENDGIHRRSHTHRLRDEQ
jgi:hypothetical protein